MEKMAAVGVPARVEGLPPLWGAYPGYANDAGLWEPADLQPGEKLRDMVIVPCGWADLDGVFYDGIDDLVAFFLDAPGRWFLLRGNAALLGPDQVWDAGFYGRPLHLFSNPLSWLQANGAGACVIDWRMTPRLHLADSPELICESDQLRQRLVTRNRECQSPWTISVGLNHRVAA
jgi:hypothetical protein